MQVTTLKAPDGRFLRAGVWDVAEGVRPRALCVLLQGHTEFLEKYSEVAEELNARGFAVASLDWRGQGASDRQRRVYGNRRGHVGKFEEYDLDLGILINQVIAPMGLPTFALAHSMGAHVLLRYLREHSRRFSFAVLTAPMLDVHTGPYSPELTRAVTFALNLWKPSTRFVFGIEDRDQMTLPFEQNLVTSDRDRYGRMQTLMRAQPYLRINGPTFGWLGAAYSSMGRMRRSGFAEAIKIPFLVVGAGRDRIVHVEAVRDFAKRLPNARYVEIEDSEHEILMESDPIRARFWEAFDAFVDEQLTHASTEQPRGFAATRA